MSTSTDADARHFFKKPYFAVVGASTNQAKFGYKIFAWYVARGLPATPINPVAPAIPVDGTDYKTLPNLGALPHPRETALSVVTPPPVTLEILQEAHRLGLPAVWLQPGTFDDEVLAFARGTDDSQQTRFEAVLAGMEGSRGHDGWCVLVDGDRSLKAVGKL